MPVLADVIIERVYCVTPWNDGDLAFFVRHQVFRHRLIQELLTQER